jgi:hypothetical protein
MKITLPVVLLFCACYFCNCVSAQQKNISDHITSSLEKYTSTFPQEKLYLHFDKEYYLPGDTIWFKAYQVNASSHEPDSISKIVYVDLIGAQNSILTQLKLKSKSGFAHGDISLPDTLQPGNYRVRAYTNWMRNLDPAFFFTKILSVYSLSGMLTSGSITAPTGSGKNKQALVDTIPKHKSAIDLQFFPEGGYLLDGLPVKVAFKALSPSGKGIKVTGSLVDNDGKFITSFTSNELGMGIVSLLPQVGKKYFAQLEGMGSKQRYALPEAIKEGYVLSLNYFKPGFVRVNARTNIASAQPKEMTLIGQCRDEVYFSAKADIGRKGYFFIDVPKADFPSGIVQFTLFDDQNAPQSERLAFINHQDNLKIEISTNKKGYVPREKVQLTIDVKDDHGNPVAANLSLSVTDADQVPEVNSIRDNILTNLLLTSDLKGLIESPKIYFRDTTKETQQSLDLLMLTHGWRRFTWKEVLTDSVPSLRFAAEKELSFSGSLANGKKAIEENRLTMMLMSAQPQVLQSPVGKNQDFYFGLPDFQDSVNVVLQTTNSKGKRRDMQVSVDEKLIPKIPGDVNSFVPEKPYIINSSIGLESLVSNTKKVVVLDKVQINAKKPAEKMDVMPYQTIDVEALEKSMSFDYANVFQLLVREAKGHFRIETLKGLEYLGDVLMFGYPPSIYFHYPAFFINGVEFAPGCPGSLSFMRWLTVRDIDVNSITRLEIGERFAGGMIMEKCIFINTYKDGFRRSYPPGITSFKIAGFSKVREFYSPKYQALESDKKDDNRATLYWNPNVQTDKNGIAKLSFYNSDKANTFSINVEGVSGNGDIGTSSLNVK